MDSNIMAALSETNTRVAFHIGEKPIYWYGIIIAAALIAGVALGVREAKRKGFRSEMVLDFMLLAIPLGIVCARLYYVIFEWENYSGNLLKIFAVWEGGLAIYGAVIGGAIAAFVFKAWRRVFVGDMLDVAAPSLIIAQAIGRWGNYVNQEAHGGLISNASWQWFPIGVQVDGAWYQATFFYESFWNVLVFIALMAVRKRIKTRGGVFALYVALYGFGRFWIESLRTDSLMAGDIRVSQVLSALLFVGGIAYLIVMRVKKVTFEPYDGYYSLSWTPEQLSDYKANSAVYKARLDVETAVGRAERLKDKYGEGAQVVEKALDKAENAKTKLERLLEERGMLDDDSDNPETDADEKSSDDKDDKDDDKE
jgi:phosphatidylglycerol:prolipoprotein diacylglycerol transferase